MAFVITFITLTILWLICYYISESQNFELEDFSITISKHLQTIMFDIYTLVFIFIFNFRIIRYIAIAYYILIAIGEGILIAIATVAGLEDDIKKQSFEKDLWIVLLTKFINEIATIIMIFCIFFLNS